MRILVVDDEPFILELIAVIFGEAGHELATASDGQDGLEKFKSGVFDLVLTDFNMPRINGFEMARAIKAADANVRIILMTGLLERAREVGDLASAFDLVLEKPLPIDSLNRALERING